MALRNFTHAAGIGAFIFSSWASAVGLGEIKLNSALNEPFDAEIKLLNLGDLNEQEILAGLASAQEFERAGVDREFILTGLNFSLDLHASGGPVIRVKSTNPVREPYLDFLIEVQWASGRLLREYTVLLDLPVFSGEQIQGKPSAATPTRNPVAAPASAQKQKASASSGTGKASRGSQFQPGEQYQVQAGDNLWNIARKIPSRNTSIQQRMMAVQDLNPDAFINGNINLLKRGHVLRLPTYNDIKATDHQQAVNDIRSQSGPESESARETAAQLSASGREQQIPDAGAAEEGRLRLSAVTEDTEGNIGRAVSGSTSGSGGNDAIRNEIAIVQEELDRTQRENSELKQRLSNLEDQLNTMQRLLELRSNEMRAAQLAIGGDQADTVENLQAESVAPIAASDTAESELAQGEAATAGADSTPAIGKSISPEATQTEVAKTTDKKPAAVARVTSPPKQQGILDRVTDYLYYILAGLALLVVLIVFKVLRGSKTEEEDTEILADTLLTEAIEPDLFAEEEEEALDSVESIALNADDNLFEIDEKYSVPDLELSDEEEVDPAGEAEIYLSLGNYDEAKEVLLDAIERYPEKAELHLKLLEVYAAGDDAAAFEKHLPRLLAFQIPSMSNRAQELRLGLSENPVDTDEQDLDDPESYSDRDIPESRGESNLAGLDETDELSEFDDEIVQPAGSVDAGSETDQADIEEEETTDEPGALATADESDPSQIRTERESETAGDDLDFDLDLNLDEISLDSGDESEDRLDSATSDLEAQLTEHDLVSDLDEFESLDETSTSAPTALTEEDAETDGEETADSDDDADGIKEENESLEELALDIEDSDFDLNDEFDLLGDANEVETQLELAQAYIDMGDPSGAKEILSEVVESGSDEQKDKARGLLEAIS